MSDIENAPAPESRIDGRSREARAARLAVGQGTAASLPPPHVEAEEPRTDAPEGYSGSHTRQTRKPMGTSTQKLAFPSRPGFVRRWFNDSPGRIATATEEGGWVHVKNREGKPVSLVVGTDSGGALKAYLLELPKEWYDEDMAAQQAEIASREDAMRRGQVNSKNPQDRDSHFRNTAQGREIRIGDSFARR